MRLLFAFWLVGFGGSALASPIFECLDAAKSTNWSEQTKLNVCVRARVGFHDCYEVAQGVLNWPPTTRVYVCTGARRGFKECYQAAEQFNNSNKANTINRCLGVY